MRQALDLSFVKPLARHFEIDRRMDDGGRFLTAHYDRLASSLGCLAYGGNFHEDYLLNENFREIREYSTGLPTVEGDGPHIIRWDSWRLWESLASGCATVALDFEEYGFLAPALPRNGVHYIGLKFDAIDEAIAFMTADRERLRAIGAAGRDWVLEHYAPKAVALRFIDRIAELNFPTS